MIDARYQDGASIDDINFSNTFAVAIASEASSQFTKALAADDEQGKQRVLEGFSSLMYDTLPNREFINNTSRYFVKQVITKSQDPQNVGWLNDSGAPVLRDVFMDDLIDKLVKQPLAVAYAKTIGGQQERLINITFDGILKSDNAALDEYVRVAELTKQLKERAKELAEQAKQSNKAKQLTPSSEPSAQPQPEQVVQTTPQPESTPTPAPKTTPQTLSVPNMII